MSVLDELARREDPVVSADERAVTGRELVRRARAMVGGRGPRGVGGPLVVHSWRAEDVIAGLSVAELLGVETWLAHGHLSSEEVAGLAARHGAWALLREGHPELSVVGPPSGGGGSDRVVLMTSGTTGDPKLVEHSRAGLERAVRTPRAAEPAVWLLTYPPTSFAGVQVVLTALRGGGRLVAPADRTLDGFVSAALREGVTHASGTPTFWRGLLRQLGRRALRLRQITLGGEAVDQTTLDALARRFPGARLTHIYATTELGVVLRVSDGRVGFPSSWLSSAPDGVQLRIREGALEVRGSPRMCRYRSAHPEPPTGDWFPTGDLVEFEGPRVRFRGRSDRTINCGGVKVNPEAVEAVLRELAGVVDCRVFGVKSPITGEMVGAEVMIDGDVDPVRFRRRLAAWCHTRLPRHESPQTFSFVPSIGAGDSGKKLR